MGEFRDVESYLLHGDYPEGLSKGEKVNLRRKCRNIYKIKDGILYYRKRTAGGGEPWKICARTKEEKKRILQSCHAGPTCNISLVPRPPQILHCGIFIATAFPHAYMYIYQYFIQITVSVCLSVCLCVCHGSDALPRYCFRVQ